MDQNATIALQQLLERAIEAHQAGDLATADELYNKVLQAHASVAQAWNLLGALTHQQGDNERALSMMNRAVAMEPTAAQFLYNRAVVEQQLGRIEASEASYREAVQYAPRMTSAWNNLGNLLKDAGTFGEACECYRRAIEAEPENYRYQLALGLALRAMGDMEGALERLQLAREMAPNDASVHSQIVFATQYLPGMTAVELASTHRVWSREHAEGRSKDNDWSDVNRDPGRQLRIGFLSPDLSNHPVGIFLAPILERLDSESFTTYCYSDSSKSDEYAGRLQSAAGHWRQVQGLDDDTVLAQIREDEIDVLFDLAGHTDNNRMPLFGLRAAPVQISWAGYVGTTGLVTMDYLLCDSYHAPDGVESSFTENLLRLPDGYVAFEPPKYAPATQSLPLADAGYPVLGGFHNPMKINAEVIAVWSELLHVIPEAQLRLKYKGMNDAAVATRLQSEFTKHGISSERIELLGRSVHIEHLQQLSQVDVFLDTFPYSGGITVCEALWMGVPVVCWPQDTFASRHSLSHATNAGFTEGVACNREEYVEIAKRWLDSPAELSRIRDNLRPTMSQSPICDIDKYVVNWSEAVRAAWQGWCPQ